MAFSDFGLEHLEGFAGKVLPANAIIHALRTYQIHDLWYLYVTRKEGGGVTRLIASGQSPITMPTLPIFQIPQV